MEATSRYALFAPVGAAVQLYFWALAEAPPKIATIQDVQQLRLPLNPVPCRLGPVPGLIVAGPLASAIGNATFTLGSASGPLTVRGLALVRLGPPIDLVGAVALPQPRLLPLPGWRLRIAWNLIIQSPAGG